MSGNEQTDYLARTAELASAARAYVAARLANDAAEPRDWSARAAEVDRTWHALVEASGLAIPEERTRP